MVGALMKFTNDKARSKASIPKYQVYDNSLKNVYLSYSLPQAKADHSRWGTIHESAIGSHIITQAFLHRFEVFYWREKDLEVDFVLRKKDIVVAIEVKSNFERHTKGMEEFIKRFQPSKVIVVGENGLKTEEFLSLDLSRLFIH